MVYTTLMTVKRKIIELVTQAGIYHNPSLGLISLSSDGENWITIADKNLGATQVYNDGDTLTQDNCGNFYQRGNNYGFPFNGNINLDTYEIDASSYGPGNYYSSNTFIFNTSSWDSSNNINLWGGVDGTFEAMQGPCQDGFRVGSSADHETLISLLNTIGISTSTMDGLKTYLKIPLAGRRRNTTGSPEQQNEIIHYWTSNNSPTIPYSMSRTESTGIRVYIHIYSTNGCSIRPFKNESVQPDTSRTVLYQPN